MAPHYKLYYFDHRGIAEPLRLILNHGGVEFEDCRIPVDKWPEWKPTMPFGHVPVLEVDGKKMPQSQAIGRFLARQFGLMPQDSLEMYACDELVDALMDIVPKLEPVLAEQDPGKRKELYAKVREEFIIPRIKIYDAHLGDSKSGWAVGNKLTWADFVLFNFWNGMEMFMSIDLSGYSHIKAHQKKVAGLESVRKWYNAHPSPVFTIVVLPSD